MTTDEPATVGSLIKNPAQVAQTVEKLGRQTFIADLLGGGPAEMTDEQRAELAERRRVNVEQTTVAAARLADPRTIVHPLARAVLALHAPVGDRYPTCGGCDYDGYESEPPGYPCRTVALIAEHYGTTLPAEWVTR